VGYEGSALLTSGGRVNKSHFVQDVRLEPVEKAGLP